MFFAEQRATLLPGETAKLKTEGTVAQPTLWSPKHPSLYTLETWLHKAKDDSAFLADKFRVGIRTFRFDADYGFFLNEIPMKIKGSAFTTMPVHSVPPLQKKSGYAALKSSKKWAAMPSV